MADFRMTHAIISRLEAEIAEIEAELDQLYAEIGATHQFTWASHSAESRPAWLLRLLAQKLPVAHRETLWRLSITVPQGAISLCAPGVVRLHSGEVNTSALCLPQAELLGSSLSQPLKAA